MRSFVVKSGQTLEEISAELIDGRVSKVQAAAALKSIRDLNPNIGTGKLKAGTVIMVPGRPGIKTAGTKAVQDGPSSMLVGLFERSSRETLASVAVSLRTREAERTELAKVFGSAVFKRALDTDRDLAAKAEQARKEMDEDQAADKEVEASLGSMVEAARASLQKLDGLLD